MTVILNLMTVIWNIYPQIINNILTRFLNHATWVWIHQMSINQLLFNVEMPELLNRSIPKWEFFENISMKNNLPGGKSICELLVPFQHKIKDI